MSRYCGRFCNISQETARYNWGAVIRVDGDFGTIDAMFKHRPCRDVNLEADEEQRLVLKILENTLTAVWQ